MHQALSTAMTWAPTNYWCQELGQYLRQLWFGVGGVRNSYYMNLLHLRQFYTWVYHTHVSALVRPLVHSLLYWSHLIQAWLQYWEKSIVNIASFLALSNDKGWIFESAIFKCWFLQNAEKSPRPLLPSTAGQRRLLIIFCMYLYFDNFIFAENSKSCGQCTEHILLGSTGRAEISWQTEKILISSETLFWLLIVLIGACSAL